MSDPTRPESFLSTNPTLMWKPGAGAVTGQVVQPDFMVVQALGDKHFGMRFFHVVDFEPGVLRMPHESESAEIGLLHHKLREGGMPVYLGQPILLLPDAGLPEHADRIWLSGPVLENNPNIAGTRLTRVLACWFPKGDEEAWALLPEAVWLSHELHLDGEKIAARATAWQPPRCLKAQPEFDQVLLDPEKDGEGRARVLFDSQTLRKHEVQPPRYDHFVPRWRFV